MSAFLVKISCEKITLKSTGTYMRQLAEFPIRQQDTGLILGLGTSQWETALLCNDVSHWLGASLKSALKIYPSVSVITFPNAFFLEKFPMWTNISFHFIRIIETMMNWHWLGYWRGTEQASSHCLDKRWPTQFTAAYIRHQDPFDLLFRYIQALILVNEACRTFDKMQNYSWKSPKRT